jgi:YrhK-like protein
VRSRGVWWRPHDIVWWTGIGFGIGSLCFALAAMASQWASAPRPAIGITFFAGSIFFTAAAFLQLWEVRRVERAGIHTREAHRLRPASWEPHRIDWVAALVQFAGTLFFNVSCFAGMKHGLDTRQTNLRVWAPDAFGSVCFLIASEAALARVCRRWVCLRGSSPMWRIAALNLVGSIAFGVAAITSLVEPSTSEPVSAAVTNAATAAGALLFLAGAAALIAASGVAEGSASPSDAVA